MTHLVFISPLPPPIFGAARSSENLFQCLRERAAGHTIAIVNTSGGTLNTHSPAYHLRRIVGFARAAIALIRDRNHRERSCYICAASGYGMLYDTAVIALARLLRTPVFLHHRSFRYIDQKSRLMGLITWLGGSHLTHIFLCETMTAAFLRRYRDTSRHLILSNAFYNPPALVPQSREPSTRLRIGLLSNLCHEKGLDDFLALLEKGIAARIPLYGILAGAPFYPAAQKTIEDTLVRLPEKLEWRGTIIDKKAKDAFFADIDVFVFPTRYDNEAQPIVVFEALSRGLPTIAFGRGCIPSDLNADCGMVIANDDDFTARALPLLQALLAQPELWRQMSEAAIARVDAAHTTALAQFDAMTHTMLQDLRGSER